MNEFTRELWLLFTRSPRRSRSGTALSRAVLLLFTATKRLITALCTTLSAMDVTCETRLGDQVAGHSEVGEIRLGVFLKLPVWETVVDSVLVTMLWTALAVSPGRGRRTSMDIVGNLVWTSVVRTTQLTRRTVQNMSIDWNEDDNGDESISKWRGSTSFDSLGWGERVGSSLFIATREQVTMTCTKRRMFLLQWSRNHLSSFNGVELVTNRWIHQANAWCSVEDSGRLLLTFVLHWGEWSVLSLYL